MSDGTSQPALLEPPSCSPSTPTFTHHPIPARLGIPQSDVMRFCHHIPPLYPLHYLPFNNFLRQRAFKRLMVLAPSFNLSPCLCASPAEESHTILLGIAVTSSFAQSRSRSFPPSNQAIFTDSLIPYLFLSTRVVPSHLSPIQEPFIASSATPLSDPCPPFSLHRIPPTIARFSRSYREPLGQPNEFPDLSPSSSSLSPPLFGLDTDYHIPSILCAFNRPPYFFRRWFDIFFGLV
ncbi:hypothetical protein BDZ94DRAFT_1249618 [Collybia nuda]|uniref:Uncharacterized protein n=1 Tax=Collybia nuda TaxID=64659 RepID=A0A9P6CI28_9AGAR|nr:hypothetical protein BDZ94DRAFT_1249618 [Collybia nuda]